MTSRRRARVGPWFPVVSAVPAVSSRQPPVVRAQPAWGKGAGPGATRGGNAFSRPVVRSDHAGNRVSPLLLTHPPVAR